MIDGDALWYQCILSFFDFLTFCLCACEDTCDRLIGQYRDYFYCLIGQGCLWIGFRMSCS
jgi:hypothetical protein